DMLVGNYGQPNRVYKSLEAEFGIVNSTPAPPPLSAFSSNYAEQVLQLQWVGGNYDTETSSAGLYYSIIVATEPLTLNPKHYIVSPSTGYGASPLLGNYLRPTISSTTYGLRLSTGIVENTTYYWQVQTIDPGLRRSSWSVQQLILPNQAPGKITDLKARTGSQLAEIALRWIAPGDDNYVGNISNGRFQIKYSTDSSLSTYQLITLSTSATPGSLHSYTLSGLQPLTTYYLCIRAGDEIPNWSVWSDTVTGVSQHWFNEIVVAAGDVGYGLSMTIDGINNRIHVAYYDLSAAELRYVRRTASGWSAPETVDIIGGVCETSIAIDGNGNPHIAYRKGSGGGGEIKYAKWTTQWSTYTVDSSETYLLSYPSIVIDGLGAPHICYYTEGLGDLVYVRWTGSAWQKERVDDLGDVGSYCSIALTPDGRPVISYYDATNKRLKRAIKGVEWTISIIDPSVNTGGQTSITIDSNSVTHISYYADSQLRYSTDTTTQTVDAGADVGRFNSIVLDGNGQPHIAYYDLTNGDLKYARYTGSEWIKQVVDWETDSGRYTAIAFDSVGYLHVGYRDESAGDVKYSSNTVEQFSVPVKARYPTALSGIAVSTYSITLQWLDNSLNEAGYRVYSTTTYPYIRVTNDLPANTNIATISNLTPNTSYQFYVQCWNLSGVANSSPTIKFTLANQIYPDGSGFVAVSTSFVKIQFNPNNNPLGTEWQSRYSTMSYAGTYSSTSSWITMPPYTVDVGDLMPNTTYYFQSHTRNGDTPAVENEFIDFESTSTLANPPSYTSPTFTEISSYAIRVNWSGNGNPSWTQYFCEVSSVTPFGSFANSGWITTLNSQPSTLNPNTTYWFRTKARNNDLVETAYLNFSSTHTLCNVPGAISFVSVYQSSISMQWAANGNPTWTIYELEASTTVNNAFGMIWTGSGTGPVTHQTLNANTTYYYRVRAKNLDNVPTQFSSEKSTHTLCNVPTDAIFTAVYISSISVSWSANNNSDSTLYEVNWSSAANFAFTSSSFTYSLTHLLTCLSPNVTYYCRIRAKNLDEVYSNYSSDISTSTLCNLPGVPQFNVFVSSIDVTWGANNNSPWTEYLCQISSVSPFNPFISSTTYNLQLTTYDLQPNTTYYYRVKAKNLQGIYTDYVYESTHTLCYTPGVVEFTGVYQSSISVNWLANNNPSWTSYTVDCSTSADFLITQSTITSSTSAIFQTLSANLTYYLRVCAQNLDGIYTAYALPTSATSTLCNLPQPTVLAPVNISSITANWTANSNPSWTQYFCEVSSVTPFSSFDNSGWITTLNFQFSDLNPNTTYWFRIKAKNNNGIETEF
ncbi:MAG: fibronectin type III domain-containing protein, partial [Elusimicrobiota bacterium]|nr:fibronectin type III domain-containing protein [Elusimicrobiota bacterium]